MSPDDPSVAPRRAGPSPTVRTWLPYVVLAALAALLLLRSGGSSPEMAYSDLKAKITAGEVAEVRIGGERIVAIPRTAQDAQAGPGPQAKPGAKAEPGKGPQKRWVAERVDDPGLIPLLESRGVKYTGVAEGNWLTNLLLVWILPLGFVLLFWMFMMRRMRPGAGVMSIGRSRARLVPEEGTGVTFADVAGVDEAVDELREVVEFLRAPERFRRVGGRIPKGVLLVGPPGTGKTLLARAVAGEAKVPFFSLTGSDFVEMFVGVGAARVRDLFERAQQKAPCIVFIDELDAIGKARAGAGSFASHDEREQTLNQLLAEMDGFDARKGLIIMGATNRPEILDPALLRPGRFDRQVLVDRPDVRGREAILRVHAKGVRLGVDVDLRAIAAITPGFAGAELANVINEAALLAARRGKLEVTMAEMNEAVERVVAGLEKKNRRMNPREKDIVAHHEAGHTLLAEVLPTTDRVHKVSMIPRGLGALGYTMQIPLEDRYLMTRSELLDKITVLLGGRAAEQTIFAEVSTGAQDDLLRATDLARRMVTQFGMSSELGPQSFATPEGMLEASRTLRGLGIAPERGHGERTQEVIDAEVAALLERAEQRARGILAENREHLERLATRLREKEVLEGAELREILAGARAPDPLRDPSEQRWEALRH